MAELPKPPSLDVELEPMESAAEVSVEPISIELPVLTVEAHPVPVVHDETSPSVTNTPNESETQFPAESLEPIDLHESGPVDVADPVQRPPTLPPVPAVQGQREPAKAPSVQVTIPVDPDAPRPVPPPRIEVGSSLFQPTLVTSPPSSTPTEVASPARGMRTQGESHSLDGARASSTRPAPRTDQTDEVPSALLSPTSAVSGTSPVIQDRPGIGIERPVEMPISALDSSG